MKIAKFFVGLFLFVFIFVFLSLIPFFLVFTNHFSSGILVLILFYLINFIFLSEVLANKRSNGQSKISWTIILILPFPTFFIYIGTGKLFFWHKLFNKKILEYEKELFIQEGKISRNYHSNEVNIEIFTSGDSKINQLFSDLNNAKSEILIEYFILNEGIILNKLFDKLLEKADQGIKIKIITDYAGNFQNNDSSYSRIKNHKNIEFHIYNPIYFPFTTGKLNLRSHNKIVLIDNYIGYFGGFNIGDDYVSLYGKYGYWYDVHFRTKQLYLINDLQKQFYIDWFRTTKQKINPPEFSKTISHISKQKHKKPTLVSFMDGYCQDDPIFLTTLINKIDNSKKTIKLVTPYLILPNILIKSLLRASKKGIQIEIITTGKADKKTAYFASRYYVNLLTKNNIKIYRTNNFFMHAKYYIFDDKNSIIGTSNLDSRSIYLHYEYNFFISSKKWTNQLLNESFKELKSKSYIVENEKNIVPDFIIKLISPIL